MNLCFGIYTNLSTNSLNEKQYESVYKKLGSFLYNDAAIKFTFHFSGTALEWLQKNHPEYITILGEMLSRKQIEILGGGFYSPLFPILQSVDRVSQIELLTTSIRKNFGRRPRGCWLHESVWDSSFISNLSSAGIEYVLLDAGICKKNMIQPICSPCIVEDGGKTIFVLPAYADMIENAVTADSFFKMLKEKNSKSEKEPSICCFFSPDQIEKSFSINWFEQLTKLIQSKPNSISYKLPSEIVRSTTDFEKVFINSGMSKKLIMELDANGYDTSRHADIKTFMLLNPAILQLYSKMTYVALLINQMRGDKERKKAAREELWKAQNGAAYIQYDKDDIKSAAVRKNAYKALIEAEKISRESGVFTDSLLAFDINMDGYDEYAAQLQSYNAYIDPCGGYIYEYDVFSCFHNFVSVCTKQRKKPGMFKDCVLTADNLEKRKKGIYVPNPLEETFYIEQKYDKIKQELIFSTEAVLNDCTVQIKKKFKFLKDSIKLEYNLKNVSAETIEGYFASEIDMDFESCNENELLFECGTAARTIPFLPYEHYNSSEQLSLLKITDNKVNTALTFAVNDLASLYSYPVMEEDVYSYSAFGIFWKLDLLPGKAVTKTIVLSAKTSKKNSRSKKN